jgi:hypothetical protein
MTARVRHGDEPPQWPARPLSATQADRGREVTHTVSPDPDGPTDPVEAPEVPARPCGCRGGDLCPQHDQARHPTRAAIGRRLDRAT